jgi:deoxyguanosinetriphosphate triphosphohydrolase-like protein
VRTRLTHSLEVSDLGRTLANKIAYELNKKGQLSDENILALVAIVENACLLHDIGNPPFGHFGEAAIKEWAKKILEYIPENLEENKNNKLLETLVTDFKEFDGNPQGLRIITKLHPEFDQCSLNLTYSTLLSMIKYPRTPTTSETNKEKFKKAGYFHTEENIVNEMHKELKMTSGSRYPFVYIMEAADDIAYCMSDIADGIEKGIITETEFIEEFKKEWKNVYGRRNSKIKIPKTQNLKGFTYDFSIPWSREAIEEAANRFIKLGNDIYSGSAESLISKEKPMGKILEIMKKVSRRILYKSFEAESIEISGYAVITGILDVYTKILKMNYADFNKILNDDDIAEHDFEKRLIHFIGKRYIKAYNYSLKEINEIKENNNEEFLIREWWLRAHLIIDHISGMTDEYALQTYQMLKGISIMR